MMNLSLAGFLALSQEKKLANVITRKDYAGTQGAEDRILERIYAQRMPALAIQQIGSTIMQGVSKKSAEKYHLNAREKVEVYTIDVEYSMVSADSHTLTADPRDLDTGQYLNDYSPKF